MRNSLLVLIGFVGLIFLVGLGFSVGQVLSLNSELALMRNEMAALQIKNGEFTQTSITSDLRVGAIRVNELLKRYQDERPEVNDELNRERERIQNEIAVIESRREAGEISPTEYQSALLALNAEWENAGQNLIAKPLGEAINGYGMDGPYDVIVKVEDVVLFAKNRVITDITDEVWEIMKTL